MDLEGGFSLLREQDGRGRQRAHYFKNQPVINVIGAPESLQPVLSEMGELTEVRESLAGQREIRFALAFATTKTQVDGFADRVAKVAAGDAVIWAAYPRSSSKKYKCEFNRDNG